MSNKRLTAVWDLSKQSGVKLLALLSLADRADDDGYCWPSHKDTAQRTRSARTYILAILRDMEADGELYIHAAPGSTHKYIVLPGMTEDEIRKALSRRFGYTEEEVEAKVSVIRTCQYSRHGVSVQQTSGVSVPLTGGVSATEHEPLLTLKKKTQKKPKSAASAAPPPAPPPSKPKKSAGKKRDERIDHPAYQVYQELTHRAVPFAWRDEVCKVTDLDKWRAIVKSWAGKFNPTNIEGMLDVYQNGWKSGKVNGSAPPARTIADVIHDRQRSTHEPR